MKDRPERKRIPHVSDEMIQGLLKTMQRLYKIGFADHETGELYRAMSHPEKGPCEPVLSMFNGDILLEWYPVAGQECIIPGQTNKIADND